MYYSNIQKVKRAWRVVAKLCLGQAVHEKSNALLISTKHGQEEPNKLSPKATHCTCGFKVISVTDEVHFFAC